MIWLWISQFWFGASPAVHGGTGVVDDSIAAVTAVTSF